MNFDGTLFNLNLRPCTAAILAHVLDPTVPFVWVRRHTPKAALGWWNASVPLNESGAAHELSVRAMEFDIQMSTSRFLELLPEFEPHGIVLYQMTKLVPDSLIPERLDDNVLDRVLVQNGLHLSFHLPHANEGALIRSPHRAVLEKIAAHPEVAPLVIESD